MNNYTKEELMFYKKSLYKTLKKYYQDYLEYLKDYSNHNLKLLTKK